METGAITLDTSLAQQYARYLRTAPAISREEMSIGVEEALLLLEREIKDNTPVGVHGAGGLRGSITHELRGQAIAEGLGVAGKVFSPLNYALPAELGSKPHFPPIAPLRDWVEAKLGVDKSRSQSVAFLVARKIARKGTKGAFMFTNALSNNAQQVIGILNAAMQRIIARLRSEK
jgi:hypothetical protein